MEISTETLLLIAPLFIVQIILMVIALLDLRKVAATRGPKWMWVLIIVFINMVGPILYFVIGRKAV
ncbi:PLD nuclease N-terminal domain-containing protein [Caryophanon tenue]|uniref:Transcriptional regulator n=1 Tax=Caryophanon tenue TaxID=33978 RepID=A0A1C0YHD4_9BACL|nr:PLD nuclease N-terminal domain-containing protein [Caryophanon tenue]OCS86598.1 transcriptional regulator [Caryophanon tenue]